MFMTNSGATLLAPSIGNLHGEYMSPPEDQFKLDLYVRLLLLWTTCSEWR